MKYSFTTFILLICVALAPTVEAQSSKRTINKSAEFFDHADAENKFRIMNINGSVTIEAYDGNTIELTVEEEIRGNASEIERGKRELEYKLERHGNIILAYLDAPFITLEKHNGELSYRLNRDDDDYKFIHDVHVKVPRGIRLEGSTINKGILRIAGHFKEVKASNVNGALELEQMTSQTRANTVNGDITVSYNKAPAGDSEYHTVNGTIKVYMPQDLSADIYFKSMHGDLYTDFNNVTRLQPQVKRNTRSNRSVTSYQVEKSSPLRIGNGGTKLQFEVLNGNVYLQKQS